MIAIRWLMGAAFLAMAGLCHGEVTAYRGATRIDGTRNGVLENATILVQGDKFIAAGVDVLIPEDAAVVDVTGKWIVPGLIDAHVHFMTSGRMYTRPAFFDLTDKVPYEEEVEWIKSNIPGTLRANLCSGVTGVISLGGPSLEYDTRALAERTAAAPTVFVGHGVIASLPEFVAREMIPPWDGELTLKPAMSAEAGAAHVREGVARGADLIKTAIDNRGSRMFGALLWYVGWRGFQGAVVEEAARHGLKVTTHAHALAYAHGAVEAGAASLQHVPADQPVDRAFIDLLSAEEVVLVPTLAIRKRTFIELFSKDLELLPIELSCSVPGVIDSWQEPVPPADGQSLRYRAQGKVAAANVKALYEGGVALAVGTDTGMIGIAAGSGMHIELRDLQRAGVPADYLIHAATFNSARVAGREDEYGSIEAGKFADFLILGADPLADIGNLQEIEWVVKHGRVFGQSELLPPQPPATVP